MTTFAPSLQVGQAQVRQFGLTSVSYDEVYAVQYEKYYLSPWPDKHAVNRRILESLIKRQAYVGGIWLDCCCGQAWHFSQFPSGLRQFGVDLSSAQLSRARVRNPDACFVQGNIASLPLPEGSCALVTSFWAGYCYLADPERIRGAMVNLCRAIQPGGDLYIEILLPGDVATFNESDFANRSGFRVVPVTTDYRRWEFHDVGGVHRMYSPPLSLFLDVAEAFFDT
ncbi:class I SAM-dependent methyltransferase, partial [Ectothiorhodospira shaposhnikovii]|uniref:class I SAM-dependent methyltransferase n=1 Tax=Ectothiorhodospira shaposhnikovii TaxID=1054 RepID=UPI001EE7B631|nr:class I SAM-dependent methyltransferase [Ectothiorhodospira shaposhnikovii]